MQTTSAHLAHSPIYVKMGARLLGARAWMAIYFDRDCILKYLTFFLLECMKMFLTFFKNIHHRILKNLQEEEDMANEVRSGSSARRRASSISSSEGVRVFAVTPSRASQAERDSFSMSRSQTNSNIQSDSTPSQSGTTAKVKPTNLSFLPFTTANWWK